MTNYTGVYIARMDNIAISTARTMVQINAPATRAIEIIRAYVTFNSTTSTAIEARLKRISTAGTGTGEAEEPLREGSVAAAATATTNHTAEGTIGDELIREWINYLNGFKYLPVPEERILIAPSGRVALDFPTTPGAAVNITAGIIWGEIG